MLVEQGLPPNPGPIGSSSSMDWSGEVPADDGSTPGYYSQGDVDDTSDQREREKGEKILKTKRLKTKSFKILFATTKENTKARKIILKKTIF